MKGQRTVLLNFPGKEFGFTVEQWFLPVDAVEESATRFALVWTDPQDTSHEHQHAVLLSDKAAREIGNILLKRRGPRVKKT